MTLNQLIAVTAVIVPCVTALLVGYWHRKQMRQLEMFRRDATVGVLPPPSPPMAFWKRYRDLIVGVGLPMVSLAFLIPGNSPATNYTAALISWNFAIIVYNLHLHSEMRILTLLLRHAELAATIVEGQVHQLTLHKLEIERLDGLQKVVSNTGEEQPNKAPPATRVTPQIMERSVKPDDPRAGV